MDRPWVAIQRNPMSGAGPRRESLLELIAALRSYGLTPRMYSLRTRLQQRLLNQDARKHLRCIVAAGGDGTVRDVINRFPGIPVAILPLGTENLLARYLGVPQSGRAVAEMIAHGHTCRLDAGLLGDRQFSLMASFGFDADIVRRVHARRSGHITKWNYVQPILQSLRSYDYPQMRLFVDDAEQPLLGCAVVVVNLPMYGLGLKFVASASGRDGLLDVCLFERGSAFHMLKYFAQVLAGRHQNRSDVHTLQATRVRIESDRPVPVQVDGDPAGTTPADVRIVPQALELLVPRRGCEFFVE